MVCSHGLDMTLAVNHVDFSNLTFKTMARTNVICVIGRPFLKYNPILVTLFHEVNVTNA